MPGGCGGVNGAMICGEPPEGAQIVAFWIFARGGATDPAVALQI